MPALKLEVKSKTNNFLRKYNCKPAKISRGSHPQIKLTEKQTALDSSYPSFCNVSCNVEVSAENIEITEANDFRDICSLDISQLLKMLLSSRDSLSFGEMCPINLETITSPGFEQNDRQLKPISLNDSPGFEQNDRQLKPISLNDSVGDQQPRLPYLVTDEVDDKSCGLTEFQAYNAFDFYISDDVTALPFDENTGLSDIMSCTCPDYEFMNLDAMLDMTERCLQFPFLDKPVESMGFNDVKSVVNPMMDSDDSYLYLDIRQLKSPDQEVQIRRFTGDLEETTYLNSQLAVNKLSNSHISSSCALLSSIETEKRTPTTLVLDLDETLVHSTLEHCDDADFTFPVFFNMKQHMVYVRQRPYLQMFLERVAQKFRVVIFTASQSIYAERLLNILDPDKSLISECFYREACIFSDGSHTKDLTILGVDLAKVIIIDNSPQVFQLQVNNGIPIKSWFDDPADQALHSLLPFLETLADVDDVRPIIAERFGNKDQQLSAN